MIDSSTKKIERPYTVKNETRKQLICERTYANWIKIWQCKICFRIFLESNEVVDHQLHEHTDKQFEDRF